MNKCNELDIPLYNTLIVEGVDNEKRFSMYGDDGVSTIDITGATATFAMKSKTERKEFACTIDENAIVLTIPDTEVFASKTYQHRLEMTFRGITSRVLTGTIAIEKDV